MASAKIRVDVDAGAVDALLAPLLEELAQAPLEVRNAFVGRFEAIAQPFCIDVERCTAAGAGDVGVALEPSDALLELVAALRAGQIDAL